jgi:uncharacterized membrane protein
MADRTERHLAVLGYATPEAARAAVDALEAVQGDEFLRLKDWAIVTKAADGQLHLEESKDADPGARRGAVVGGVAGTILALATGPLGVGAVVAGAAIGGAAAALRDSGFKTDDLDAIGALMRDGRSVVLVAVEPAQVERLSQAIADLPELRGADWRREIELSGDKRALARAIEDVRREQASGSGAPADQPATRGADAAAAVPGERTPG